MISTALQNILAPTKPMSLAEAMMVTGVALVAAPPVVAALYLLKSAVGINLMAGPSPLHNLLYHFVV